MKKENKKIDGMYIKHTIENIRILHPKIFYTLFIVLSIILILVVHSIYYNLRYSQPSFTITTEECRNECSRAFNNGTCYDWFKDKICEQKEVDRIIFGVSCSESGACGGGYVDKKYLQENPEWLRENCECLDEPYGISSCKKDYPDYCIIKSKDSNFFSTINDSIEECRNFDCGSEYVYPEKCSKYSCSEGKYEVTIN